MSVNDEGDQFPAVMPEGEGGEGFVVMPARDVGTPRFFRKGAGYRPRCSRAAQPAGAVFALGWVMAELFDPRRRASVSEPTPPFDPVSQLPLAADLAADPKLVFLAAELSELLRWFPRLHRPLRLVTTQTNKKRAAVSGGEPGHGGGGRRSPGGRCRARGGGDAAVSAGRRSRRRSSSPRCRA